MKRTIGIDLGTTNTTCSIAGVALASDSDGGAITPSVVAFPPNGATLVGTAARKRRAIDPKNTIFSAKRLMGQSWHSRSATHFRKQYPMEMTATQTGECAFRTRAGVFTPVDIASYVIGTVLSMHRIEPIECDAVIAVPASFAQAARDATIKAAERAGLREVSTVEEPVATAVAYLSRGKGEHRKVAVYDLGGGTFDLAILDSSVSPARVIGYGGDSYLGGDDIDKAISDWAAHQILERHAWDVRAHAEPYDRLMVQCERAKVRLCFAPQTRIELSQVDPGSPAAGESVVLDRETLQRLSNPFIARTFLICDRVLREAGVKPGHIDAVFLAGGTTLLPAVREGVARYFGAPAHIDFDPLEVVSAGASLIKS